MSSIQDKQRVMLLGIDKLQRVLSKQVYVKSLNVSENEQCNADYHLAFDTYKEYEASYGIDWHIAKQVNHNSYKRAAKVKTRIKYHIESGNALWLTLTFTDAILASTTASTRRRYVARFLKEHSSNYVANIDYGTDNGREHYHAVIQCDRINDNEWQYGFSKIKRIGKSSTDAAKISKYITKLTNHAIKQTTRQARLIYPKSRSYTP